MPSEADIERVEAAAQTAAARNEREKADVAGPDFSGLPSSGRKTTAEEPFHTHLPDGSISPGPPGLIIKVTGRNAQERGSSYEEGIREYLGIEKPVSSEARGGVKPDGILGDQAFEVKYLDDFSSSIYNPDIELGFNHEEVARTIEQVRKYGRIFSR